METKTQALTHESSTIVERVARIVSSVRGTNPEYAQLAAELEPAIPFDLFGIVLLRHDRQAVRVTICTREQDSWKARYHQHPLSGSKLEQLLESLPVPIETRPPLCIQNYTNGVDGPPAECGDALSGSPYLNATLIAPLIVGDHVLGTLELGSTSLGAYNDESVQRLIGAVVRVLAAAIERTQLGGSVEIQDRQREALKHVSSALTTEMDLSTIFNRIVDGIAEALQVASAVLTLDSVNEKLRLEAQSGLDANLMSMIVAQKLTLSDRSIFGATLRHRQPFVSQDIGVDERFPESHLIASTLGIRSIFSYPLITGEQVYGELLLCSPQPGGFTPLKADILSLFASHATIAIHNGLLLETARKRRRFQQTIEQLENIDSFDAHAITLEDERNAFDRLRHEVEQIYGIRFSTLLRFLSDNLLPQSEKNWQSILHAQLQSASSNSTIPELEVGIRTTPSPTSDAYNMTFIPKSTTLKADALEFAQQEQRTGLLHQMAEAALTRAGVFGNVSAAFISTHPQLYEQITNDMIDAWFLVDLEGHCLYMNPAAEVFCGVRLGTSPGAYGMPFNHIQSGSDQLDALLPDANVSGSSFSDNLKRSSSDRFAPRLEDLFAGLLVRARNAVELRSYLHDFSQPRQNQFTNESSLAGTPQQAFPLKTPAELQRHSTDLRSYAAESEVDSPEDLEFQTDAPGRINGILPTTIRCVLAIEPLVKENAQTSAIKGVHAPISLPFIDVTPGKAMATLATGTRNRQNANPPTDHHYQLTRFPLTDKEGRLVAYALQVHDITEQVRDEKNKSVLLSSVSHDLRTPLTTIKAAVSGLLQSDVEWDDESRREILEEIESETDHLSVLVNALVDMSRIEMGALILEKEWCDLVELVHGTISRLDRILSGRTLQTRIQPLLPLIQADYVQLERVFRNLLENAAKHSPEHGEILLTLEIDQGMLRAQVIDQGKGVPESERDRIFNTFYSSDAQGSGLGLAICRGIIEAHGGRIWVESAPNNKPSSLSGATSDYRTGSCFVFVLPLHS